MSTGTLTLHRTQSLTNPVVLTGEIASGRWHELHRTIPNQTNNTITITITEIENLAILILCEESTQSQAIHTLEAWFATPWKLDQPEQTA
jgi:hypothetical protein